MKTTLHTDYLGNLILRNGEPQLYRFAGGYYNYNDDGSLGDAHYYISDYQGNNRMVVNASTDEVEQVNHYYAYGGLIGDLCTGQEEQEFKFGDKKLDRTYGLDLYDFEARQYDVIAPWFTSIDPLAEKYYSISPYAYCAGDPVNLVDRDGRKIEFAEGCSEEFKAQFRQAYDKLVSVNAGDLLTKAINDPTYTIVLYEISPDSEQGSGYKAGKIGWSPYQGLITENSNGKNYYMSPMEILNHEIDHGVDDQTNHSEHTKNSSSKQGFDEQYDRKEERRVITGSEQDTAKKLGKIKEGEQTRTNHQGTPFITSSSTSDEYLHLVGKDY